MTGTVRFILFSRIMAALAALIVLVALIGYATHRIALIQVQPGLRAMSPLTAAGLLSLAIAVFAASFRREPLALAASTFTLLLSVIVLGNYAFFGNDVTSSAVGHLVFGLPPAVIGRTSIATAAALALLSVASLLRQPRPSLADTLAGCAALVSGMALLGYLYGVADLYALPMFNSMALNTATAIFLLSLAALFVKPDSGWARLLSEDEIGAATQRQLSFIALPVITGWALLRASGAGGFGPAVAMALMVIATVVPLVLLVLRDSRIRITLDRERRDKIELQDRLSREMTQKLDAQAEALALEGAERAKAEAAMFRAQRMEAVGQLTGGIAHDFNNLLMAIRGNLELMQRRAPATEDRLLRYVENAILAADRGAKITGQLLSFSRSQRLNIHSVEVDPVLKNASDMIGNSLGPDIAIILDFQTEGLWIRADPDQLELAILNLAVNARDAMPRGGCIRIESRSLTERLSEDSDPADFVSIRIADNGSGMSEDVAVKAIEPFFTTKETGKGTGLGLPQVYGFARQCEGDLRITTAPGEGTTVEILLPRGKPAPSSRQLSSGPGLLVPAKDIRGKTVLVIDDDDTVRGVIVDALRTAGFEVVEAADGKTGLALMDQTDPAAAVIDFIMPGLNGAQVARIARATRPELPIVFVSGYSDTVALEGIKDAIVLRKPFDISGLNHALNEVLH